MRYAFRRAFAFFAYLAIASFVIFPRMGAANTVTDPGLKGDVPSLDGNLIAYGFQESWFTQDLNGDGDTEDALIHYYDITTGVETQTGVLGYFPSISGNRIAFRVVEGEIGQDLDGDGVITFIPQIRYYDISTGTVTNPGIRGDVPSMDGNLIAYGFQESWFTQDLNGDGDTEDALIHYYDITTGVEMQTGVLGYFPSISGNRIAFRVVEGEVGQDLDGDGVITFIPQIRYYDISTGTVSNSGPYGGAPSIDGNLIAYEFSESWFTQDLNGDGDTEDAFIHYYNIMTGVETKTGVLGKLPSISGNRIAFRIVEGEVDQDLDGDGVITYLPLVMYIDNTPTGADVSVQPIDATTGMTPVTLTFDNVLTAGTTNLTTSSGGQAPPVGFKLGNPATYYELTTTATFTGSILVCIDYTGINVGNESKLKIFHLENGVWVNRTVSLDTTNNIVCGEVTSLSPFAIFEPDELSVQIDIKPGSFPNSVNSRSHGNIPVAVLSAAAFDALQIDIGSLKFGSTGSEASLISCQREDVNHDGQTDLICHFDTRAAGFKSGDFEGVLTGQTIEGILLRGTDAVRIVH